MIRYIPEGVPLPTDHRLRDKVCYILHLINHLPLVNDRVTKTNGYVSLSSVLLSRTLGRYRPPLYYLIDNGIIETDGRYLQGEESLGYRMTPEYSHSGVQPVIITTPSLVRK